MHEGVHHNDGIHSLARPRFFHTLGPHPLPAAPNIGWTRVPLFRPGQHARALAREAPAARIGAPRVRPPRPLLAISFCVRPPTYILRPGASPSYVNLSMPPAPPPPVMLLPPTGRLPPVVRRFAAEAAVLAPFGLDWPASAPPETPLPGIVKKRGVLGKGRGSTAEVRVLVAVKGGGRGRQGPGGGETRRAVN